jgi:hypothetical protein
MLKLAKIEIAGILDINTKKCLSLLATSMKFPEIKEYFSFMYISIEKRLKPTLFAALHIVSKAVVA